MVTKQQKDMAYWILEQVGTVNPYNRRGENLKNEYYIYQGGYLAAYLASLMEEDPWLRRRFEQHVKAQRGPAVGFTKKT